jgi:hypothetical protein
MIHLNSKLNNEVMIALAWQVTLLTKQSYTIWHIENNNPEESIQRSEHSKSLKSIILCMFVLFNRTLSFKIYIVWLFMSVQLSPVYV